MTFKSDQKHSYWMEVFSHSDFEYAPNVWCHKNFGIFSNTSNVTNLPIHKALPALPFAHFHRKQSYVRQQLLHICRNNCVILVWPQLLIMILCLSTNVLNNFDAIRSDLLLCISTRDWVLHTPFASWNITLSTPSLISPSL